MLTVKEIEALRERRAKLRARLEELGENEHAPAAKPLRPKNPRRQGAAEENRPKAPLTVKEIQKLTRDPKRRPYEILDADGLYLTIRPSGGASFNLRYRFGGRPRNLTIGPSTLGLAEARRLAAEARGEIARGNDPCAQKKERVAAAAAAEIARKAPIADSVAAVAERFVAKHVQPKTRPASRKETERLLRAEILPRLGARRLGEISRAEVRRLVEDVAERAPIVANRTLALLRKLFNWAKEQDLVGASPCDGLKPPAAEKSRDRVLTDDEVALFWRACEAIGWPFGPLAQMLLLTGQRRDEVGAATWAEIDLETVTWLLAGERVKNDREHLVPLTAGMIALLESLPRIDGERGFVFTTSGAAPVDGFSRAKNRIDAAMLEIARRDDPSAKAPPHWQFHDLRRTCASGMASLKVQPHVIEAVLNHRSGAIKGVAATYNRYAYADEKRAALEAWGRRVELLATGEAGSNVVTLRTAKAE